MKHATLRLNFSGSKVYCFRCWRHGPRGKMNRSRCPRSPAPWKVAR